MNLSDFQYKITYLPHLMALAFVRLSDNAIIYSNDNETYVRMFAVGFCQALDCKCYIE